jgi:hypothetical protein
MLAVTIIVIANILYGDYVQVFYDYTGFFVRLGLELTTVHLQSLYSTA